MGKRKTNVKRFSGMPVAPWIYINDPTPEGNYASQVAALIPSTVQIAYGRTSVSTDDLVPSLRANEYRQVVAIVSDQKLDHENHLKLKTTKALKEGSICHGCNFASVNIINDPLYTVAKIDNFGTNHLNVYAYERDIPQKIYKWLFSVLTIRETLHLIPEAQMKQIDSFSFPDFAYCPINESHLRPKDAKLQFVALILAKPQVGPGQRITFEVADRTGTASFYFQYRGTQSKYTWDWVLNLKPGERKALPRMPMVQIKEKTHLTIMKAPFRLVGATIGGTGLVVKGIGNRISRLGDAIRPGPRCEWVAAADVDKNGNKITHQVNKNVIFVPPVTKTEIKVFKDNGEKTWSDNDSNASTEAASVFDEKQEKQPA